MAAQGRILKKGESSSFEMSKGYPDGSTVEFRGHDASELVFAGAEYNKEIGVIHRPKVRILFLSANPIGTPPLELIKECNNIREKVSSTKYRSDILLDQRHEVSLGKLQSYLLPGRSNIVHFSGHGSTEGKLIFENSEGESEIADNAIGADFILTFRA